MAKLLQKYCVGLFLISAGPMLAHAGPSISVPGSSCANVLFGAPAKSPSGLVNVGQLEKIWEAENQLVQKAGLPYHQNLKIELVPTSDHLVENLMNPSASYDFKRKQIVIPDEKNAAVIMTHELGHAFFDAQLAQFKEWAPLAQKDAQLQKMEGDKSALLIEAHKILKEGLNANSLPEHKLLEEARRNAASNITEAYMYLGTAKTKQPGNVALHNKLETNLSIRKMEFENAISNLQNFLQRALGPVQWQKYSDLRAKAGALNQAAQGLSKEVNRVNHAVTPYHEFRADFASILRENNPDAVARIQEQFDGSKDSNARSFKNPVMLFDLPSEALHAPKEGLKIFSSDGNEIYNVNTMGSESPFNPYNVLDAAKYQLYLNYLSEPRYRRDKAKFLRTVSDALAVEAIAAATRKEPLTIWDMNMRLISEFEKKFSQNYGAQ